MAFDRGSCGSAAGDVDYPVNTAERFAVALQQFIWSSGRCGARENDGDEVEGQRPMMIRTTNSTAKSVVPLPDERTLSTLHALQRVLGMARQDTCHTPTDPVTEAGLFLMRFTRLLEQQTLAQVQEEMMKTCFSNMVALDCVSPIAQTSAASDDKCDANPCTVSRSASRGSHTVHSRGRRYTVPGSLSSSSSFSPSLSPAFDTSALATVSPGEAVATTHASTWRYHADLTLQMQQCMLRWMSGLDATLTNHAADDGGLWGILTHPRAAQLQTAFLGDVTKTLVAVCARWRGDARTAESASAVKEVSAVVERLQEATHVTQGAGASLHLHVYELSGAESTRRSPPPFASRRRSTSFQSTENDSDSECWTSGGPSPSAPRSDIERCLGVAGADYPTKLVAQQLWCAQKLLSQRFPSYAATWDVLERARFLVESTRSPTPTVPRSDSCEHLSAGDAPVAATAQHDTASPDRAAQHEGGTPPPCVTTTQPKSERPVEADRPPPSPPFRSLTYSEERTDTGAAAETGTDEALTATTLSPSRRSTASPPALVRHASPVPRLLPVAPCPIWENLLVGCGVSAHCAVAALQHLGDEGVPAQFSRSPLRSSVQPLPDSESCFLSKAGLNVPSGKPKGGTRKLTYSIEMDRGAENNFFALPTKRLHARSS